jgi:hypothetical protein
MRRVTGIGGILVHARDAFALRAARSDVLVPDGAVVGEGTPS